MEKFLVTEIKGEYRVLITSRSVNEIADTYYDVAIFSDRKSAIAYKHKLLVEEGIVFECQQYDDVVYSDSFFGALYHCGKFSYTISSKFFKDSIAHFAF